MFCAIKFIRRSLSCGRTNKILTMTEIKQSCSAQPHFTSVLRSRSPKQSLFISTWTPRHGFSCTSFSGQTHAHDDRPSRVVSLKPKRARRQPPPKMSAADNGMDGSDDLDGGATGIIAADLRQEMTRSYMEYAMSVIMGRAMPDVRDGLKPVHRRILFVMHDLGLNPNGQFRKCARVVGDVLGKYHPHGESAVYDALVRMAQPFSMSVPLVNGHGNFGSTDGDPPAAMRYTECKLASLSKDVLLADMDKDTVPFVPNFDGSEMQPLVLPAKVPNLLINGSSGIAVGMATSIPPHNLGEVVSALKELISNPEVTDEKLLELIPGPDFPTGGQILGTSGARDMYLTGRGRVILRSSSHFEVLDGDNGGKRRQVRDAIVVTELPYQVNKAVLVAKIAELVNEKKLEGVSDLRDESDRNGTRIVIELKRDAQPQIVLNNLFKKTQLQSSFSGNVMALDSGRFPVRLTLRDCLEKFLQYRRETLRRRISHDLRKAQERFHVVQGLLVVQDNVDEVVTRIRESADGAEAKAKLMSHFGLTDKQADVVLSMQLRRLTSLEKTRLVDESNDLDVQMKDLKESLSDSTKVDNIMISELSEIEERYATPRRSIILKGREELSAEVDELHLTSNERSIITVTERGYIKRMPTSAFQSTKRGTRGKRGAGNLRKGDKIAHFLSCMSHDSLLAISKSGVAYVLPAYKIPLASIGSRGVPIFQLIPDVPVGETMASVLPMTEFSDDHFLALLTKDGYIKKTAISEFESTNSKGKRIIGLEPEDELKWVRPCTGADSVLIASQNGYILRFSTDEKTLRASGRTSRGVRAVRLEDQDSIADMDIVKGKPPQAVGLQDGEDNNGGLQNTQDVDELKDDFVLAVTRNGTGKRIRISSFRTTSRGCRGVKSIKLESNGQNDYLVALQTCEEDDSVMVVTRDGTIVRTKVDMIPVQSRYSKGVRIQRLPESDTVAAVAVLPKVIASDEVEVLE